MPARGPRYEARKAGLKHYFTGRPCSKGHVCDRLVSNKCCVECNKIKAEKFRADDPERHRKYVRRSRKKDPQKTKEQDKRLHAKHREKRNEYSRLYNKKHSKRLIAYSIEYRRKNPDKYNKFADLLRTRLRIAIKGKHKEGSAVRDLGCSIEWFMAYIAAKFSPEMNWENHGKVWELDHVVALSKFDLTKREHLLRACHFTNLQPLSIRDHREKTSMEIKQRKES